LLRASSPVRRKGLSVTPPARVGAELQRTVVPGEKGVTTLALGGTPGQAYRPPRQELAKKT